MVEKKLVVDSDTLIRELRLIQHHGFFVPPYMGNHALPVRSLSGETHGYVDMGEYERMFMPRLKQVVENAFFSFVDKLVEVVENSSREESLCLLCKPSPYDKTPEGLGELESSCSCGSTGGCCSGT